MREGADAPVRAARQRRRTQPPASRCGEGCFSATARPGPRRWRPRSVRRGAPDARRTRRRGCRDRGDRQGGRSQRRARDLLRRRPRAVSGSPPRDPALYFVQRLRDEAHRFAIGTHRARRKKDFTKSPLDEIAGIGPARKRALLHAFGTAKASPAPASPISKRPPASTPRPPSSSTTLSRGWQELRERGRGAFPSPLAGEGGRRSRPDEGSPQGA